MCEWLSSMRGSGSAPTYIIFDVARRWDDVVRAAKRSGLGILVEPLSRDSKRAYSRLTIAREAGVERGIVSTPIREGRPGVLGTNPGFLARQECALSTDFIREAKSLGYALAHAQGLITTSGWVDVRTHVLRLTSRR